MLYRPTSYLERLDLGAIYPKAQPLELELGAGDGSFLVEWARRNPQHNFLGVERLLGRLRKIERKATRAGLQNLRLMRIEASYFLEYLMPLASVTRLHVYFPDPWPKRKHRANRLVNTHFTQVASGLLIRGGEVLLRTDDSDYFNQMTAVFGANSSFAPVETLPGIRDVKTDFERGFNERGTPTLAATYRRQ